MEHVDFILGPRSIVIRELIYIVYFRIIKNFEKRIFLGEEMREEEKKKTFIFSFSYFGILPA